MQPPLATPPARARPLQWDLFCRVIDNLGDVGLCWRLAVDLAQRGQHVRLVLDDHSALTWMAPNGHPGVQLVPWPDGPPSAPWSPGDVAIEAFGCDPPPDYVQAMQRRGDAAAATVWVNLEYLSAEPYVARSHRLPSPQRQGLMKWFFFPGFTPDTGGLIRETDLAARQATFDPQAWLQSQAMTRRSHEQVVSLFCYDNPAWQPDPPCCCWPGHRPSARF
jgi:uncharacterized repeat protein (TIGR03837 family)